jgi:hypothetical protein
MVQLPKITYWYDWHRGFADQNSQHAVTCHRLKRANQALEAYCSG